MKTSPPVIFVLGLMVLPFTAYAAISWGETITAGSTEIKADHINEIRSEISDLESQLDGAGQWADGDSNSIYYNLGNVGIGDISPNSKLEVNGQISGGFGAMTTGGTQDWNHVTNARSGNGYSLLTPTAANGPTNSYYHSFNFEYGSKDGSGNLAQLAIPYYSDAQNKGLYIRTRYGGTWQPWSRILSENIAGNVGIGTTSPSSKLDVAGGIEIQNNNNLSWGAPYSSGGPTIASSTGGGGMYFYPQGNVSGATMLIRGNGNVGIGTTSPSSKLDVVGTIEATKTITGGGASSNWATGNFGGAASINAAGSIYSYSSICVNNNSGHCSSTGGVVLGISNTAAGANITSGGAAHFNGNVGIGTTSPSQKLDVNGGARVSGVSYLRQGIETGYAGTDSGLTGTYSYRFGYQEGGSWSNPYPDLVLGYHTGVSIGGHPNYGGTRFFADHPSSTTNVIAGIGDGGRTYFTQNVGIGTTSPSTKLQVNGTVTASNFVGNGSGLTGIVPTGAILDYTPGNWEVASNSNSSSYGSAALEVRELNNGGAQTGALAQAPRIAFHWGGRVASQIGMGTDGVIRTFNNPGTGYEDFAAQDITANGNLAVSGTFQMANDLTFSNYGVGPVGTYSSTRYQNLFSMGAAYTPADDGTSLVNMYGIAWTHSNVGGESIPGLGYQALFVAAGDTRSAIGYGIWTKYDITGNRFIDQNDSAYYLDPASTSYLNDIRPSIMYDRDNTAYYLDPASTSYLNDIRPSIMYDRDNTAFYVNPASTTILNDARASIFYDRDNTAFYVNPASTTILNDARASIFYDRDNTAYYVNPNVESRLNDVRISGNLTRSGHNVGHLEGSYNNVGNNQSQTNPIYTIGSSYNPAATTLGNMYGIGFTHSSSSFLPTGGWGMYVAADGDARSFISGSAGGVSYLNKDGGNVGIGTTSPSQRLEVSGRVKASGLGINSNPGGNLASGSAISIGDSDTGFKQMGDGNLAVYTNNLERMRFTHGGNIGIGVGDPVHKLSIGDHDTGIGWGGDGQLNLHSNGYTTMSLRAANVGINTTVPTATLSVNGPANKPGGGSWDTFSDARLKDITGDYVKGLDEIVGLNPIEFNYKADNVLEWDAEVDHIGLIAQEVQTVFPEAVEESENGYLSLDSQPINMALINAVKELKTQNDALKTRLEALENQTP